MKNRSILALALAALVGLSLADPAFGQVKGASGTSDLKPQKHLLEVGLYMGALFPSSVHELFRRTEHQPFQRAAFDVGLRLSYLPVSNLGLELEAALMPTKTRGGGESALLYALRGHVIVQFPVLRRLAPFVVIGGGGIGVRSKLAAVGNDHDSAFHYGGGLKYYPTEWMNLRLDFRHIVSARAFNQDLTSHFEALAGVSFVFGWKNPEPVKDSDGDGVPDDKDKCPDVAAKTADGCPPDKDGDGVPDDRDRCPDVAAKTADGCPPDRDGDGVPDDKDKCPDVAAKTADGCPPDRDGDGVPDDKDKCPDVAAKTEDGCPPDRDGDGIPDDVDKCPDKPETFNGYLDEDGCPDELPQALKLFTGAIQGITFAMGKAVIVRASFPVLDRAAEVLKKYPHTRIAIRGHTDDSGPREVNVKLSLARAQAVKDYLVKKGVDEKRIDVKGLGPDEPVADNKTRAGKAKNRRIEFKLLTSK